MKDFASFEGGSEEIQTLLSQYGGKSEKELVQEIFTRAMEGKKKGTLTNEQIDAFYAQFAPSLDPVRRRKLQKLVEQLKRM